MELKNLLISLLYAAPMLIVYLLACILGLVHLNKHKKAALLAMLGGLLAGLVVLGNFAVNRVMDYQATHAESDDHGDNSGDYFDDFEKREKKREQEMAVRQGVGICSSVFEAVGVGLILFAVFAGRKGSPGRERWQEEDDDRRREARDRRDDRGRTRPT